ITENSQTPHHPNLDYYQSITSTHTTKIAKYTNDTFMLGGEIVAFVEGKDYLHFTVDGKLVQMTFSIDNGVPTAKQELIMHASEISNYGHRIVALDDEMGGYGFPRGYTKYYLLTVKDESVKAQYIAFGDNGGMIGAAGTISEPIDLTA
ncbi:MAG: hypothetical protein II721_05960, partial [Bacilli bacterium]|nr:hypothetical protein [Bacilli bacterium]